MRTHEQDSTGQRQSEKSCIFREGPVPLVQPGLETVEASDGFRARIATAELQYLTACNRLAFFVQNVLQVLWPQLAAAGQGTGRDLANSHLAETAAGLSQFIQDGSWQGTPAAGADAADQSAQVVVVGKGEIQQCEALFQITWGRPLPAAKHQRVRGAAQ